MIDRNRFMIGRYHPGTGFIYRLDPRTKIIVVLLIMVSALVDTSLLFYAVLTAVLLGVLGLCRLEWRLIISSLKPVALFIIFTALFHLVFSGRDDPQIVFSVGSFVISRTALVMATTFSTRILIFVLATFVVSLTTSPLSISEAIVSLLKPLRLLRIPIYDLGMILFIALRFIPVLADEIETIRKAQFIRGIDFSGGLRTRIKRSVALILPVFFSALRRADDLSVAIETRGYRSGQPRSSLYPLKYSGYDIVVLGLTTLLMLTYLLGNRLIWQS